MYISTTVPGTFSRSVDLFPRRIAKLWERERSKIFAVVAWSWVNCMRPTDFGTGGCWARGSVCRGRVSGREDVLDVAC
nr:hypothetical protein CFP56_66134 [Quercus suber]